jgi:hypothetical protein
MRGPRPKIDAPYRPGLSVPGTGRRLHCASEGHPRMTEWMCFWSGRLPGSCVAPARGSGDRQSTPWRRRPPPSPPDDGSTMPSSLFLRRLRARGRRRWSGRQRAGGYTRRAAPSVHTRPHCQPGTTLSPGAVRATGDLGDGESRLLGCEHLTDPYRPRQN